MMLFGRNSLVLARRRAQRVNIMVMMSNVSNDRSFSSPPSMTINRTSIAAVAIASSLPFGACFAWSVLSVPLSTELGVISALPLDWDPSSLLNVFSLNICGIGLTTAFLGRRIGEMGPKRSVQLGSFMWGGGLLLSSYAVSIHDITLLYLGYGVLGTYVFEVFY